MSADQGERNAAEYDRRMGITEPGQLIHYSPYDPAKDKWTEEGYLYGIGH